MLTNRNGLTAEVISFGATLIRLRVPDRNGVIGDICLGFDELQPYETVSPYMGATIGRVANRIDKGRFELDGKTYQVPTNNGPNALHGGPVGYNKRVWDAEIVGPALGAVHAAGPPTAIRASPGTVKVAVTYALGEDNALRLSYTAVADAATPIALTNHTYFNLKDAGRSPIDDHVFRAAADRYLPVDGSLIPTGQVATRGRDAGRFHKRPPGRGPHAADAGTDPGVRHGNDPERPPPLRSSSPRR